MAEACVAVTINSNGPALALGVTRAALVLSSARVRARSSSLLLMRRTARCSLLLLLATTALAAAGRGAGAAPAADLRLERDGHTRIPFDLRGQHVWVRGRVNDSDSIWIVIDTGASASLMDESVARGLALKMSGRHEARGAAGTQISRSASNVTVSLPGLSLHRDRMDATDLSAFTPLGGHPMQLVLGYELFQSCVVRFDYPADVMDVWDAEHAPKETAGATVPMTLINHHPYVEAALTLPGRAPLKGRFVIDTGSSMALLVAPEVAARDSVTAAFPKTMTVIARGVGGELKNQVGRAASFSLGSLEFSNPTVVIPEPGGRISTPGSIGNIGGQILGRCRVTFDYPHQQIHFEPGATFDRPFETDMLGATLTRGEGGVTVRWVNPGTPAAESGLQVGDVVTQVDGEVAASIDPAALKQRMQNEGREVTLRVRRGAETIERKVTLRRLI